MELIGKNCTLLYKQNISTWLEDQKKNGKFSNEDLDLVELIATKYKDDDDSSVLDFVLDNHIGSVYKTVPEPDLFTFAEADGTVTKYSLSLEGSNLDGSLQEQGDRDSKNDVPGVYICSLIKGSISGRKFLAYAAEGHIFLMDMDEKNGVFVGQWSVDPSLVNPGHCTLVPYDPKILGAVTTDSSLVAASGPDEGNANGPPSIVIRLFNNNTHECVIKKMNLEPTLGFSKEDAEMISFNPLYNHLIYITFISEIQDDNDDSDDDDDDDDDDMYSRYRCGLVLFDTNTEKIIAKRSDALLMLTNYFYETIGSAVYLCHGNMIVTYKLVDRSIVLVDALSLDALGVITLSTSLTVLQYHFCVSKCQSELAIFKDNKAIDDSELQYEVEVYKIPDADLSLKNLCRKEIGRFVSRNQVDILFMLPVSLRDYLRL